MRAQDSVSDSNSNSDTDSLMHSAHKSISIYRFRSSCLHSAQTDREAGRQAGETQETKETGVAAFHPISLKAHLAPPLSLSMCGSPLVLSACLFVYWPTKRKFSVSINNRLWLQSRTMPARCWSNKAATCCTTHNEQLADGNSVEQEVHSFLSADFVDLPASQKRTTNDIVCQGKGARERAIKPAESADSEWVSSSHQTQSSPKNLLYANFRVFQL